MQYFKREKITGLLAALVMFIGGTSTALAVGTASGTSISNTATVDYTVGSGSDARSANDTVAFTVDNRVDLTVVNQDVGNNLNVAPGSNDQPLEFLVTNTGNTTQGYLLSVVNGALTINMNNVEIWIESNATLGLQTGGATPDTLYTGGDNAFDLDPNGGTDQATVYIVADTPAGATEPQVDNYSLLAETAPAGGVGNPTAAVTAAPGATAGVDIVFADDAPPSTGGPADGSRDGDHSATASYTVASAAIALDKTIESTVDEFGTGFSIPGAVVNYELTVTNNGGAAVDNNSVSVTDPIPTNSTLCIATAGSCTAPAFTQGAPTSNLTAAAFEYSIVAGATACDNASFVGYTPTDGDSDGIDDNNGTTPITCVRQQPTGSMAGSGGTFDIDFYVVIN